MKIAAWNTARGLSDPERFGTIWEGIEQLDADVVVISESLDRTGVPAEAHFARELGYQEYTVEYQDQEPHPSRQQYLTVLTRIACDRSVMRFATRNGIHVSTSSAGTGQRLDILAVHGDDRDENRRLAMYHAALNEADKIQRSSVASSMSPDVVIAGDLNSMPAHTLTANVLRSAPVRGLARVLPHARLRSLATRTTQMARGEALGLLEDHGFRNANQMALPTMVRSGLALTLDHILHRGQGGVVDFAVHNLPGSDHRAISGVVV